MCHFAHETGVGERGHRNAQRIVLEGVLETFPGSSVPAASSRSAAHKLALSAAVKSARIGSIQRIGWDEKENPCKLDAGRKTKKDLQPMT